jgi:uncharacterized membrane protein YhaH (DUF805 family)
MDWKNLFFAFQGRVGRKSFWLGSLALCVVVFVIYGVAGALFTQWAPGAEAGSYVAVSTSPIGWLLYILATIVSIWGGIAIQIKRWHDRDKSGWWCLIGLVPVVGPIWALVETGFLRGTAGANRFGSDPLAG